MSRKQKKSGKQKADDNGRKNAPEVHNKKSGSSDEPETKEKRGAANKENKTQGERVGDAPRTEQR